jgi:DNA-directed RNA polymerase sigma subunit (sigma70/sigma32)
MRLIDPTLTEALVQLTPTERRILELRNASLDRDQISFAFHLTARQAGQIEAAALRKIRSQLKRAARRRCEQKNRGRPKKGQRKAFND